jgi:hypothetical protein
MECHLAIDLLADPIGAKDVAQPRDPGPQAYLSRRCTPSRTRAQLSSSASS